MAKKVIPPASPNVVHSTPALTEEQIKQVKAYWSKEKMANAKPVNLTHPKPKKGKG